MKFFQNIRNFLAKRDISFIGTHSRLSVETLLPEERNIISKTISGRQEEFASGRWCARKALEKLSDAQHLILAGNKGEPLWPEGICGSISHTEGAYCAAVAFSTKYNSLGIDIENIQRKIKDCTVQLIVNNDEFAWLSEAGEKRKEYEKLTFCAKESVFKLLYPIIKHHFSFPSISILPPSAKGYFSFILNDDLNNIMHKGYTGNGFYFYNKKWLLALSYLTC